MRLSLPIQLFEALQSLCSGVILSVFLGACASDNHLRLEPDLQSAVTIGKNNLAAPPVFKAYGVDYIGSLVADGEVDAFLGIPFARPPVGSLRWMPPQPLPAASDSSADRISAGNAVAAQKYAPACMQGPHMVKWYKGVIDSFGGDPDTFPAPQVSEDCLYLNIWRPSSASSETKSTALPVLVFIHGGSNKGGWAFEPNYIGEQMAKRGVIVVTIPYRLGVFGFFPYPGLSQANFALLDQIAALKWIQDNITTLGGDPEKVTVSGESAGANNIEFLMASPLAKGMFRRAIHQSGGSVMRERAGHEGAAELARRLLAKVSADGSPDNLVAARATAANEILSAVDEIYGDHYFDPVVDGDSVTLSVADAVKQGALTAVDLLIGSNADEWTIYLDPNETVSAWLHKNLSVSDVEAIQAVLQSDAVYRQESPRKHLDRLITGQNFTCPSLKLAQAVARAGGQSWVYYFSKVREGELAATMGAYHGAELPYVFDTHDDWLPTDAADHRLTDEMMNYWVQFIKTGNPNVSGMSLWPTYAVRGDQVQNLGVEINPEPHSSQNLCDILMP